MLDDEDIPDVTLDDIVEEDEEEIQQTIEDNLKKIKFHKSKLRFAQECYYGNKGKSPLTRVDNIPGSEVTRAPVHARLGRRTKLRTFPMNISTDTLLPKNRRILRLNRKDINTRGNSGKFLRLYRSGLAQLRIDRIRQQQQEALQSMQLMQPVGKFRLRRRKPTLGAFQSFPTNYTVQIPNNTFMNGHTTHSLQAQLDLQIQDEILRIQMIHSRPHEVINALPSLPIMTVITLNDRFSALD